MDENTWTYYMAKKAYEAYCGSTAWKSAITGADLPPFEKCPESVKKGWIAAAKALIVEIGR